MATGPVHANGAPSANRLTDSDQLAEFFVGWNGRFEQITAGPFEGTLHAARGEHLRDCALEFNQVIAVHGGSVSNRITVYPVTPANADGLRQGRRLDPGQLVVHDPDTQADHRSARRCANLSLSLPTEALRTTSSAVSVVAREFGFIHLGNFAADFRRLFGHLPSEGRTKTQ